MGVISWSWCRGWVVTSTEDDLQRATDEVNQILMVAFDNAGIKPIDMEDAFLRVRYRVVSYRGFKFNVYEAWDEVIAANRECLRQIPLSKALYKVWCMTIMDIHEHLIKEYSRYSEAIKDGTLAYACNALTRAHTDGNGRNLDQNTISALFGDMIAIGYSNAAKQHGIPTLDDVDQQVKLHANRLSSNFTYGVKLNHLSNNRINWNGRVHKTK